MTRLLSMIGLLAAAGATAFVFAAECQLQEGAENPCRDRIWQWKVPCPHRQHRLLLTEDEQLCVCPGSPMVDRRTKL